MSSKEYMLKTLHKLYRSDKWVNELFNAVGLNLDNLSKAVDEVYNNTYFDICSEKALEKHEQELAISYKIKPPLEDRRAVVRSRWIGSNKVSLPLLQEVADSWKHGLTKLLFENGRIKVLFRSPIGVPIDLDGLKSALENTKPAHLAILYVFMYLTWQDALNDGTWGAHHATRLWHNMLQDSTFRNYILEFMLIKDEHSIYQVIDNDDDIPPAIKLEPNYDLYAYFNDFFKDVDISFSILADGRVYMEVKDE